MLVFDFSEKIAVVTGGASGIGAEVVRRLAESGATVIAADISFSQEWSGASDFENVFEAQTDVSQHASVERLATRVQQEFRCLDVLVNVAGIFPRGTLSETSDLLWDEIIGVNLKGVFHCCQSFVPLLAHRAMGASIVNVGSVNATGGAPDLFAYSTSKGGVSTLTRNLARALAPSKIRVNCVHPGWVLTPGEDRVQRAEGQPKNWSEIEGRKIPLGRILLPEDIAPSILFLASSGANQITGQEFAIDGGSSLR